MLDDFDGPAGTPPFDERALPATMLIDWVRATVPPWPTTQR